MCHTASAKKLGGIVVDGAIRDVDGIRRLGMPAFSRSVSPGACDKDGPGEINLPIACGDTVVMPGDLVVGDKDGVAVVPRDDAEVRARGGRRVDGSRDGANRRDREGCVVSRGDRRVAQEEGRDRVTEPFGGEPLLLMTPGPTRVPERVLRAGARPMIHHRTPEFSRELAVALELLRPVFGTTQTPLPIHTTGRGALEADDLQSLLARRRDRRVLQRQVRRDVGALGRIVRRRRASFGDTMGAGRRRAGARVRARRASANARDRARVR